MRNRGIASNFGWTVKVSTFSLGPSNNTSGRAAGCRILRGEVTASRLAVAGRLAASAMTADDSRPAEAQARETCERGHRFSSLGRQEMVSLEIRRIDAGKRLRQIFAQPTLAPIRHNTISIGMPMRNPPFDAIQIDEIWISSTRAIWLAGVIPVNSIWNGVLGIWQDCAVIDVFPSTSTYSSSGCARPNTFPERRTPDLFPRCARRPDRLFANLNATSPQRPASGYPSGLILRAGCARTEFG